MESEEDLLAMLAAVKQQKAALDQQHQVVQSATAALATERAKLAEALKQVQSLPGQLLEPLKTAVENAAERGVLSSTSQERKALKTAVDGAVGRLAKAQNFTGGVMIVCGIVGGILGTALTGGVFWYAVNSGLVHPPMLDSARVAALIRENLPAAPAPAPAPRRKPRPQQQQQELEAPAPEATQ
jgi:hypothetical protein